jgi:hypothetical protein
MSSLPSDTYDLSVASPSIVCPMCLLAFPGLYKSPKISDVLYTRVSAHWFLFHSLCLAFPCLLTEPPTFKTQLSNEAIPAGWYAANCSEATATQRNIVRQATYFILP